MAQPTQELQIAIQHLHAAIAAEPDPEDMAVLGKCLTEMMKVQAKIMAQQQGGPGPAQGPPPAGPQTPANPLLALMRGGAGAGA